MTGLNSRIGLRSSLTSPRVDSVAILVDQSRQRHGVLVGGSKAVVGSQDSVPLRDGLICDVAAELSSGWPRLVRHPTAKIQFAEIEGRESSNRSSMPETSAPDGRSCTPISGSLAERSYNGAARVTGGRHRKPPSMRAGRIFPSP